MRHRPNTAQCIVVAIDAKRRSEEDAQRIGANGQPVGPGWDVYSHGGRKNTGLDALAWAQEMAQRGAGEICSPAWTATAPSPALTWP